MGIYDENILPYPKYWFGPDREKRGMYLAWIGDDGKVRRVDVWKIGRWLNGGRWESGWGRDMYFQERRTSFFKRWWPWKPARESIINGLHWSKRML